MHLHVHRHRHQCPPLPHAARSMSLLLAGCVRRLLHATIIAIAAFATFALHTAFLLQRFVSVRFWRTSVTFSAVRSTLKYFRSCGSPSLSTRLIRIMLYAIVPLSHRPVCQH